VPSPNGLVYLAGQNGLGTLDPATNTVTNIGNWPSSFNTVIDLYYANGILYGTAYDIPNGNPILVQIDVNNPTQSTVVGPLFITNGAEGGTWNGTPGLFYIDLSFDIYFYDPITGNSTLICDIPSGISLYGLSFPPLASPSTTASSTAPPTQVPSHKQGHTTPASTVPSIYLPQPAQRSTTMTC
jgi:hypothetical protein